MRMTEEIGALMTALAKAQGAMEDAGKDSTNPHFKSRYATLAAVRQAVRKPFADNGLLVMQFPRTGEGYVEIETILGHESGQYISDILRMPVPQFTPQGIGAVITYAKRYALMAIAAVASSDDDDDANAGEAPAQQDRNEWPVRQAAPPKVAKPPLAAVKADPALVAFHSRARSIAKEGVAALGAWWGTLDNKDAAKLDMIYNELADIAKAADAAEVMRAG